MRSSGSVGSRPSTRRPSSAASCTRSWRTRRSTRRRSGPRSMPAVSGWNGSRRSRPRWKTCSCRWSRPRPGRDASMRLGRLLAVARKEVLHIRRDPRSLGMAFAIPMLLLFLYGYALTLDVNNLRTIVYDQDRTATSRDFLARFTESRYFTVVAEARRYAAEGEALDSGGAQVGLVVPCPPSRPPPPAPRPGSPPGAPA